MAAEWPSLQHQASPGPWPQGLALYEGSKAGCDSSFVPRLCKHTHDGPLEVGSGGLGPVMLRAHKVSVSPGLGRGLGPEQGCICRPLRLAQFAPLEVAGPLPVFLFSLPR